MLRHAGTTSSVTIIALRASALVFIRGLSCYRLEGIFGLLPLSAMSLVSRSTARSTGRPSASEMGVRSGSVHFVELRAVVGEELHHLDHFGLRAPGQADGDVHDGVAACRPSRRRRRDRARTRISRSPAVATDAAAISRLVPSCALQLRIGAACDERAHRLLVIAARRHHQRRLLAARRRRGSRRHRRLCRRPAAVDRGVRTFGSAPLASSALTSFHIAHLRREVQRRVARRDRARSCPRRARAAQAPRRCAGTPSRRAAACCQTAACSWDRRRRR